MTTAATIADPTFLNYQNPINKSKTLQHIFDKTPITRITMPENEEWWNEKSSTLEGQPHTQANTQQVFVSQASPNQVQAGMSAMVIIALVLSIVSLCCCGPLAIAPLIMGSMKLSEISGSGQANHPDKGLAITSIIISILALVFFVISFGLEILMGAVGG